MKVGSGRLRRPRPTRSKGGRPIVHLIRSPKHSPRFGPPLLAITTHHQGRNNGMVAGTGVFASLVPEAPRVLVEITKTSLTHDLVLASRVFALHTLPATPDDALKTSLSLVRTLGMRSGHDGDKMAGIAARAGVTGSPILAETLTYVEARVVVPWMPRS